MWIRVVRDQFLDIVSFAGANGHDPINAPPDRFVSRGLVHPRTCGAVELVDVDGSEKKRSSFTHNADGSVDPYLQASDPGSRARPHSSDLRRI